MFETQGFVDESFLREAYKYIVPESRKIVIYSLLAFYGLVMFLALIGRAYEIFSFFTVLFIAILLLKHFTKRKGVKTQLQRMAETNGKPETEYHTICENDGIVLSNLMTGASAKFNYVHFDKLIDIPSAFIIITKSGQFIPVFKNKMTGEQQSDFVYFINTKCNWKN